MTQSTVKLVRGNPRDELIATLALLRAEVAGPHKLTALLDEVGSSVDLLPGYGSPDVPRFSSLMLDAIDAASVDAARREVEGWEASGLDVRTLLQENYPSNLRAVFDKPPVLFMMGTWNDQVDSCAVAVVGTRSATPEGSKRAYRLAAKLASAGVTVISGLARGIDSYAHRGALKAGGRTAAVLGTGILRRYPRENAPLADEIIASGGALISQFFPSQHPTKWTFPVRNVTMSGLSLATIVVEAGATSGAKMQAEAALTHGRSVFLPSSLVKEHPWAQAMIRDGYRGSCATEVHSPEEVVERLHFAPKALPLLTA